MKLKVFTYAVFSENSKYYLGGDKDSFLFSLGVTLSTFSDFLGKSVYITVKVLEDE